MNRMWKTIKSFFSWLVNSKPRTPEWLDREAAAEKARLAKISKAMEGESITFVDVNDYDAWATKCAEVKGDYQKLADQIRKDLESAPTPHGTAVIVGREVGPDTVFITAEWRGNDGDVYPARDALNDNSEVPVKRKPVKAKTSKATKKKSVKKSSKKATKKSRKS